MKLLLNKELRVEFTPQVIVLKIGSAVIASAPGELNIELLKAYAATLHQWLEWGRKIIIVSSGAVASGIGELGWQRLPRSIPEKQALAAIGQSKLMHTYSTIFSEYGRRVAQILLTRDDLEDRRRYLNFRYTLEQLFDAGVIPIVNENDTTAIEELRFSDNDLLSALVAAKMQAELLILLSVVEGLYDCDPKCGPRARLIPVVEKITEELEQVVSRHKSWAGLGGMKTKLEAAQLASLSGSYTLLTDGREPRVLERINKGEARGTLFLPAARERLSRRARWLAFGVRARGQLVVDRGAADALVKRHKSLLPAGVVAVEGKFQRGDVVEVLDPQRRPLAKGLVSYNTEEIEKIKGHKTSEIKRILGYKDYDELIHRDNLVLLPD